MLPGLKHKVIQIKKTFVNFIVAKILYRYVNDDVILSYDYKQLLFVGNDDQGTRLYLVGLRIIFPKLNTKVYLVKRVVDHLDSCSTLGSLIYRYSNN